MNIEELFDNELYHSYGLLTTEDANLLTNYLKEEVMEYVDGLQKRIAELEEQLEAFKAMSKRILDMHMKEMEEICVLKERIAELEEQNLNMMALFRDFYELEFNRDECWDIIKKYGGDA